MRYLPCATLLAFSTSLGIGTKKLVDMDPGLGLFAILGITVPIVAMGLGELEKYSTEIIKTIPTMKHPLICTWCLMPMSMFIGYKLAKKYDL